MLRTLPLEADHELRRILPQLMSRLHSPAVEQPSPSTFIEIFCGTVLIIGSTLDCLCRARRALCCLLAGRVLRVARCAPADPRLASGSPAVVVVRQFVRLESDNLTLRQRAPKKSGNNPGGGGRDEYCFEIA